MLRLLCRADNNICLLLVVLLVVAKALRFLYQILQKEKNINALRSRILFFFLKKSQVLKICFFAVSVRKKLLL
jgi:hypothetical protein